MATLLKHQRTRCVQWCSDVYGLACVVYHADVDDSKCAFVCVCFRLVLFFLNFPPFELFFRFLTMFLSSFQSSVILPHLLTVTPLPPLLPPPI